jgi:GTP-binding protein Era
VLKNKLMLFTSKLIKSALYKPLIVRYARRKPFVGTMPLPSIKKRLDVVIMGSPNVGKSVLLNTLIRTKIAATSRKRHTTRSEILGVFNHRTTQIAFYDTPGFVQKDDAIDSDANSLRDIATNSAEKADVILLVVDAARTAGRRAISTFAEMAKLALLKSKVEVILVLNKVDLVDPKYMLLETTRSLVSLINGIKLGPDQQHLAQLDTTTFMISALKNDGVTDLINYLISIAPVKPWIISDEDGPTDLTMEERVEEMIREQLMDNTHQEIPYISNIECISIATINNTNKRKRIEVDITVDTPSQQRIIIGQNGRTLVKIRQAAVAELEKIFKVQIILFLWIKIKGISNDASLE